MIGLRFMNKEEHTQKLHGNYRMIMVDSMTDSRRLDNLKSTEVQLVLCRVGNFMDSWIFNLMKPLPTTILLNTGRVDKSRTFIIRIKR